MSAALHQRLLPEAAIRQLLQQAPPLPVDVQRVNNGSAGELPTPRFGAGLDFAEARAYQPGDDPRHIDWRATARAQTPMSRAYYQEMSAPFAIVLDRRTAMRFGTRRRLKVCQALRCALLLAGRAVRSGQAVQGLVLDEAWQWLPVARDLASLQPFVTLANAPCPPCVDKPAADGWSRLFADLTQRLGDGGSVTLCTDFHALTEHDLAALRQLTQSTDCRAVIIRDPLERILRDVAPLALQWHDQEQELSTAADVARLHSALAAHQRWREDALTAAGVQLHTVCSTDDTLNDLLRWA